MTTFDEAAQEGPSSEDETSHDTVVAGLASPAETGIEATQERSETEEPSPEKRAPVSRSARRLLAFMIVAYVVIFGFLTYRQQSNFGTFGYDMGMHDQAIWLASRGLSTFDTIRGLDYFGQHINLVSLLFVPFYWLGAGPHLLIILHTIVVACCAVPLWLLTRDRLHSEWLGLIVPAAWLLHPAVNWVTWWGFHPDSLSMLPMLYAYWFATRRRWKPFAAAVFFTLICKEDDALAIAAFGIIMLVWKRVCGKPFSLLPGGITAVCGVFWYALCTKVLIPWRLGGGAHPFYNDFFPALGNSIPQVIKNAIVHPSRVWHLAKLPDRRLWYLQMAGPVAFLPLLAIPALLIAGPQIGVDVTAQVVQGATIKSEYASIPLVGIFLATAEALGFIYRHWPRLIQVASGLLLGTSIAASVAWGLGPWSFGFHSGNWEAKNPQQLQLETAVKLVGPSAGVSDTYFISAHLTHRKTVYEFPNPWINSYYGLSSDALGDPANVQYLVLATQTLDNQEKSLFAVLTKSGGQFKIIYDQNEVVVAERVLPSSPLPNLNQIKNMN